MAKRRKPTVVVVAFADLPGATVLLDAFGVPRSLASRAMFVHLKADNATATVFERHPERNKLATKVVSGGMALVDLVVRACRWEVTTTLGIDDVGALSFTTGFHADLDAKALRRAFEADGFRVVGSDGLSATLAERLVAWIDARDVWRFVDALDDVAIGSVLETLVRRDDLPAPPPASLERLGGRITPADAIRYRALLDVLGDDLVARALPVIERFYAAARRKSRVTKLPRELATLLSAFAGIPALGVMSASEVADATVWHRKRATTRAKPRWDVRDEAVRADRYWRAGWTPFWTNGGGDYLCIDDEPTARGTKGQVVAVWHDPPELRRVAPSLGHWLWDRLAEPR